jgi:hypothetical protein
MRSSDTLAAAVASTVLAACATPLPGGDLGADTISDGSAPLPVASGCLPFHGVAGLDVVSGAVRSLPQPDGGALFVVDDAVVRGTDVPSLGLFAAAGESLAGCLATARLSGANPSSVLDPPTLSPLSGLVAGGVSTLYYTDPSGSIGVAVQDPTDGRFRPGPTALWTSDRPAYGTAAVLTAGNVDVIGCHPARFLDSDCFAARAPEASTTDESTYTYYVGSGRWSPSVDDAWPMTSGASSFDVVSRPSEGRWLMVYVGPVGSTIFVRSGLAPEGPWSAPVPVATCDLADSDMFCAGVHVHPLLASPRGTVVVSYAAASLSADSAARRAAEPSKWWPRFATLALPPLP